MGPGMADGQRAEVREQGAEGKGEHLVSRLPVSHFLTGSQPVCFLSLIGITSCCLRGSTLGCLEEDSCGK